MTTDPAGASPVDRMVRPGGEACPTCGSDCNERDELTKAEREIERMRAALTKANSQAEHFEREWYLRGDALEALANAADDVGVLHFDGDDMPPEVQRLQAATLRAREVLGPNV